MNGKNGRKIFVAGLAAVLTLSVFSGCGSGGGGGFAGGEDDTDLNGQDIYVLTREEGSGTRNAFIELFGIEEKDADGNKVDHTTQTAEITNSTSVIMMTVAGNKAAVGYISLGSLDDSVKALQVDGVEATADNIKNGDYAASRPFHVVYKEDSLNAVAKDFLAFIMSEEGQAVVEESGYISVGKEGAFEGINPKGTITVAGSSSVAPVMEKLKEAYEKVNSNAKIQVQQSDSSTGITSAIDGVCDIGMASRELTDDETGQGITPLTIAMDGIVVIVNPANPADGLTSDQIRSIFTADVTSWDEILE